MREETQSIPLTGEIVQEQYKISCANCMNVEVIDYEPSEANPWICVCQKRPEGVNRLSHCSTHQFSFWGDECIKCMEASATGIANNLKSIHIDYGLIGKHWPKKKRNHLADEGLAREKAFDREQTRIEQEQRLKKEQYQNAFSINKIPGLLESLNEKLDKLLQIHGEGFNVTE